MRRSHRKQDDKVPYGINTDVTMDHNPSYDVSMDHNPSYDVTKDNTVDYSYDTINPGGSDVPMITIPSYNVHTELYSKTSEDEYNYVQPNDVDGYINIYPTTGQSHGIRGIHSHSTANTVTPKQEDEYGVVNKPRS